MYAYTDSFMRYSEYGFGYDATYILVIIGAILSILASFWVSHTYRKYAKVMSASGLTGAQVAEIILQRNNVADVSIAHVSGDLTDHYDSGKKVVRLSDSVYDSTSVAAIGVAAHECGHVMQHHEGYIPLNIRTALVPLANFGSNVGIWVVMLGLFLGTTNTLAMIGVVLFSFGVLFQIVTLPVEFDASARALRMLTEYGILDKSEERKSAKVLRAAAMTYVAAAAASVLQLLRLILIVQRNRNDD